MTSGLHTAPVSATEHRSSTERSAEDTQSILLVTKVQVRDLLQCAARDSNPEPAD